MKNKQNNLHKAIGQLPESKAPDKIWNQVEKELLNSEKNYQKALNELPSKKAPDKLWQLIEARLDGEKKKVFFIQTRNLLRIAASFAVILTLSFAGIYLFKNRKQSEIFYSVEVINEDKEEILIEEDNVGLEILEENCDNAPEICETPLYIELNAQLKEIKTEQEKLKKEIEMQSNPDLLKFYYRLENEKVMLEKSLIKMFIES